MSMVTDILTILTKTVEEAPKYEKEVKTLRVHTAIVVKEGTVGGYATVDLQCVDELGNEYIIMANGSIFESLGKIIKVANSEKQTSRPGSH